MLQNESVDIEAYLERRGYKMTITSSGLRYMIYDSSGTGPKASTDDLVTVSYKVSLLNGDEIYNSADDGELTFVLEKSDIARGFQEGIKFLSKGDKALMIIPAHLAYGLTGDGNKIQLYEAIVVDTELMNIAQQ
jgi:FKBP-type peptidyl-prolyl cis-trans isomerase